MLVSLKGFGRLGNRLFLSAHLRAFCYKHGFEFKDWAMLRYAGVFPELTGQTPGVSFLLDWFREKLPWERRYRCWHFGPVDFDSGSVEPLERWLRQGSTVYFRGWLFRGQASLTRFRPQILKTFLPNASVLGLIDAFWSRSIRPETTVVGVHIRWEDYRGTANFLTLEEYQRAMHRMVQLLGAQPTQFVVFSNETLDAAAFSDFDATVAHGSAIEDLYTMARCDYLLAPPSTFSGWASFYGAVPILWLNQGRPDYELKDFEIVRG